MIKRFIAFLAFSSLVACAQPAQIIVLRHAEKPDDPLDLHLSPRGEDRARSLAVALGKDSILTSNAPIAALYATRVTKQQHSQRTGETLEPLAKALSLPIRRPWDAELYSLQAREILSNQDFRGKTVVICWTHHDLAEFAEELGVHPKPAAWKDKVFDRFWIIHPGEPHAKFEDVPQHLLKGDSKK